MNPRPKNNQLQKHADPSHQGGIPEFHGYVDTRRHGLGILLERKTTVTKPDKESVVGLAWVIFICHKSSGKVLGTFQSFEYRNGPSLGLLSTVSTDYFLVSGMSQREYSRRKPGLDRCLAAMDGAEFAIAHDADFVSQILALLTKGPGKLPGPDFPEGFPLDGMCDWSGGLSYHCRVHALDQEPGNKAGSNFQTILQALGHSNLHEQALHNILHGKLCELVDGLFQRT